MVDLSQICQNWFKGCLGWQTYPNEAQRKKHYIIYISEEKQLYKPHFQAAQIQMPHHEFRMQRKQENSHNSQLLKKIQKSTQVTPNQFFISAHLSTAVNSIMKRSVCLSAHTFQLLDCWKEFFRSEDNFPWFPSGLQQNSVTPAEFLPFESSKEWKKLESR